MWLIVLTEFPSFSFLPILDYSTYTTYVQPERSSAEEYIAHRKEPSRQGTSCVGGNIKKRAYFQTELLSIVINRVSSYFTNL